LSEAGGFQARESSTKKYLRIKAIVSNAKYVIPWKMKSKIEKGGVGFGID
jgi:hypothetical protein